VVELSVRHAWTRRWSNGCSSLDVAIGPSRKNIRSPRSHIIEVLSISSEENQAHPSYGTTSRSASTIHRNEKHRFAKAIDGMSQGSWWRPNNLSPCSTSFQSLCKGPKSLVVYNCYHPPQRQWQDFYLKQPRQLLRVARIHLLQTSHSLFTPIALLVSAPAITGSWSFHCHTDFQPNDL